MRHDCPPCSVTVADFLYCRSVVEYTERKIRRWTLGTVSLKPGSFLFKLCALDWLGTVVMLGTITCLVLALQWGGNQ